MYKDILRHCTILANIVKGVVVRKILHGSRFYGGVCVIETSCKTIFMETLLRF